MGKFFNGKFFNYGKPAALVFAGLTLAPPTFAEDPKQAADDTWISVSGTVVKAAPDWFRLDYSGGVITVEMDDFDFYAEGKSLLENDKVVVYGVIDDDLFETRTIEASSVYVENLQTHFYANAADEEDPVVWTVATPIHLGRAELTGYVTAIDGREFTLDTGRRSVKIDTKELHYNPMDDQGYLKIDLGDRVRVAGEIDPSLFESHEIDADWITEVI